MWTKVSRWAISALLSGCWVASSHAPGKEGAGFTGLTVHEWGTLTSVAGKDGQALEWSPLTGSTDLPRFVEHLSTPAFKLGLRGTVRMETPVLYFYDSREEQVSVRVDFQNGLITEWYPRASRVEPAITLFQGGPRPPSTGASIAWDAVTVAPSQRAEFPQDPRSSHYFAARMTTATPLRVRTPAGEQQEKFLFYRGVSTFSPPLEARLTPEDKVQIENRAGEEIPSLVLLERRGQSVDYRIGGPLRQEAILEFPKENGTVEDLARVLEGILVAQGLYQDEAHAMLETWRDSWFEEGSRLLYIVPRGFLNRVLPLAIAPAPVATTRVFVGRMELVTAATEKAVENAFAAGDSTTLAKYGRFLEPFLATMIARETSPSRGQRLRDDLSLVYDAMIEQGRKAK